MLKVDLHIHTVASRHAHNTILEYINQAKKLKMKIIGISDHGPQNSSTLADLVYFKELVRVPPVVNGIRVLKGVEANIIDHDGSIDIPERTIERLDYVMAGLHTGTPYQEAGARINTEAIIKAIMKGPTNIITHPFVKTYLPLDTKKVSRAACRRGVLLELNLSYLHERSVTPEIVASLREMVNEVRRHNKKLIISSDAHNIWELGDDRRLKKYQKQIGLTDDLIINNYPKELFKVLGLKK